MADKVSLPSRVVADLGEGTLAKELAFKNMLLSTEHETSLDGILVVGEKGEILSFNKRFAQMWHIPPKLMAHPSDQRLLRFVLNRLVDPAAFLKRVEYLYVHKKERSWDSVAFKDGRTFDRYSAPMLGPKGRYLGRVWFFHDITPRKKAQDEATLAAKQWSETFDAIPDLVSINDKDFRIVRVNKAFAKTLKMKPEDLIGRKCYEVVHGTKVPPKNCPHSQLLRTRRYAQGELFEPLLGFDLDVSTSPIFDRQGRLSGSVHVVKNVTERKRMVVALAVERERLSVTLNSIGDGVIATEMTGRVVLVNKVAEKLTGWTQARAQGKFFHKVFRIISEKTGKPCADPIRQVLKEGRTIGLANHMALIARGGAQRSIADSVAPIRDAKGEVIGAVLVFRDVTESRKVEMTMRRLAAIVDSADDAIIGKNLDGTIVSWNKGAGKIYGYSEREAKGRNITFLVPRDRRGELREVMEKVRRGKIVKHFETQRRTKGGALLDMSLTISPIRDEDGKIVGASTIAHDITPHKRLAAALAVEQERLSVTLDSIGDGVIATDTAGRVVFVNKMVEELTGWTLAAALGKSLRKVFRIINERTGKPCDYPIRRVLRTGTMEGLAKHTALIARDGTQRSIADSASCIRDAKGEVIGIVLVFRDITESKKVETRLAWLASFPELALSPVVEVDSTGDVMYINPACRELFPDMETKGIRHPWLAEIGKILKRFKQGSIPPVQCEVAIGGAWYHQSISFVREARTLRIYGSDITERKKAAEALRHSRHLLQQVVDVNPALIAYVGPDYRYLMANATYQSWVGLKPEEIVGRHVRDVLGEDAWKSIQPYFDRALAGEQVVYEREMSYAGAAARWVYVTYTPDRDEDGRVRAVVSMSQDISERKRAEKTLQESETRFRTLFEAASDGVVLVGIESKRFVLANSALCRMLGYSAEEMKRLGVEDAHPKESLPYVLEQYHKLVHGEIPLAANIPVQRKDGSIFYADISGGQLVLSGETFYMGSFRDISERKKAEDKQRELIEDLKRTNAEIEQFNHLIAHDLQEPLRMVTNYLQLVIKRSQDKLDADALEFMGFAVEGSKLMQGMIKDLLNYSRMETHHGRCPPVDLSKVLEQALSNLRMAITESGAVIDHGVLPAVCADESQMLHLLQNLIGNALKFRTKDAPRIAISAQEKPDEVVVSVADNGIGIDPQFSDRIFQIFQRLHPRSEYPGNGIGLAFCKKIVEGHGGRIWVESAPGKGSKFYFALPRKGEDHG